MAISNITDQTFHTKINEGLTFVDFWAPWCGPCRMVASVLEEIDSEMSNQVSIVKLNIDENQETKNSFEVMSIPTLMLFKNGEVVDKVVGYRPKEILVELISKHI